MGSESQRDATGPQIKLRSPSQLSANNFHLPVVVQLCKRVGRKGNLAGTVAQIRGCNDSTFIAASSFEDDYLLGAVALALQGTATRRISI